MEWAPVTIPVIIRDHPTDPSQFDRFLQSPLKTDYPCHQQAVERAVALMTDAKLRCADDDMKTAHQGIVAEERKRNPAKSKKRKIFG